MRKLVSICKVEKITPIIGADLIEAISIKGWIVVAQKGIHSVGDTVLYFEIDSFLPSTDPRFESFMKFGTRAFNGVVGHRVKTVRLRGVYSQGIIMPLAEFPEIECILEDHDYSEAVGVVKWERSEETGMIGNAKGSFPSFLRKSDQERIQNLYGKLSNSSLATELFVGTMKMDGSSITVFHCPPDYQEDECVTGYCSRNQQLKFPEPGEETGKFYQGADRSGLFSKVTELHELYGSYYAIQGELVGPGIQGNFEKFDQYQVFAYNIFDIQAQQYVDYGTFAEMAEAVDLQICPVVYEPTLILSTSLDHILSLADGKGVLNSYREGIVWKQLSGTTQFKAISNKYLAKEE